MSHLNTLEVYSCLDTLFSTLYGNDVYRQWKELKSRLQFDNEHMFVKWMLDYINDNYVHAQQQLAATAYAPNAVYNGNCQSLSKPTAEIEHPLISGNENDTIIIDLKDEEDDDEDEMELYRNDSNNDDDESEDMGSWYYAEKEVPGTKMQCPDDATSSKSVNYLDIEMAQDFCDAVLMGDSAEAQEVLESKKNHNTKMHVFRPFRCDICGKRYSCRGNLIQHQKEVHISPKRYPCDFCNKTFSRGRHLDRHVKTLHLGIRQFLCVSCKKGFSRRDQLLKHMSRCQNVAPQLECNNLVRDRGNADAEEVTNIMHGALNHLEESDYTSRQEKQGFVQEGGGPEGIGTTH